MSPPVSGGKQDSFLLRYALSCTAATVAETLTYPLDLTKTRLQIQGEVCVFSAQLQTALERRTLQTAAAKFHKLESASTSAGGRLLQPPKLGMFGIASGIVREEGARGLWRGVSPAILRHMVYTGVRIVIYEQLREGVLKKDAVSGDFPMWKALISGVVAGGSAQLLASPADLMKVQLQMEGRRRLEGLPPRVSGLWDAASQVVRRGGVRALWAGWLPNVQRAALVNMADLATYDKVKHSLLKHTDIGDNWLLHGLSSIFAGFAAAVCSTPMDVVKTRIMNQPTDSAGRHLLYKGTIDCLAQTVSKEGVLALYKGFVPIWTRMGPWSLTFWVSYEEIRALSGSSSF